MYTNNPVSARQLTPGQAQQSTALAKLTSFRDWLQTSYKGKTPEEKAAARETETYTQGIEMVNQAKNGTGAPPTGGAQDVKEVLDEIESILKEGGRRVRKSTLKTRRGGKQNVRGTRRRKNRANRTHSHAR